MNKKITTTKANPYARIVKCDCCKRRLARIDTHGDCCYACIRQCELLDLPEPW